MLKILNEKVLKTDTEIRKLYKDCKYIYISQTAMIRLWMMKVICIALVPLMIRIWNLLTRETDWKTMGRYVFSEEVTIMEVQQVYSTSIKDERFSVDCIVNLRKVRVIKFVVDTGAMFTCCNYTSFDKKLCEEDLADNDIKLLGGFVKGIPVKFYKCSLKQFTIGNIDMGEQDIWITFDVRVTDTVLGMDILQQVLFIANT